MHLQFSRSVLGRCAQRLAHSDCLFTKQFGGCSCPLKHTLKETVLEQKLQMRNITIPENFVLLHEVPFSNFIF